MSQRLQRVEDMLRNELAQIIRQDVRDPRVGLATVAGITVTRDLSHAKVMISVLGDAEEERLETVRVLDRAKGFIRSTLAKRVRLRTVPALDFQLDRGAEHSQRINEILASLETPNDDADTDS